MANPLPDNVIPLAASRRRTVNPESAGVINDCRDMALKRITELLARTFDKIEDELFDMAEKSLDRDAQNLFLDARSQSREKRSAIETAFRKQFVSFFERKVDGGESAEAKPATKFNALELSLVEDCDLEEKLALEDIARRLTDSCDAELGALSQRMGFLLSEPDMNDEANPIAPDTVVRALKIACDQITSGYQTRIMVMRLVEQHMAQDMLEVYRDINRHLVSRQILPQVQTGFRKAQTRIVRKNTAGAEAVVPGGEVGSITGGFASPANDLFATLQQLMSTNAQPHGSVADVPAPTVGAPAFVSAAGYNTNALLASLSPGAAGNSGNTNLLATLTQIQRQMSSGVAMAGDGSESDDEHGEMLNVLHRIRPESVAASTNPIDAMTIDIVAMLFDYVFDDKSIPDAVKALIARLQIPVLKVAITDKSFFSKKTHAARRLLDVMADASLGLIGDSTHEDPLYKEMARIVGRVQAEYDADLCVFADSVTELEKALSERELANDELVERSARTVHEREKREMGRLIAADEIGRRVDGAELPTPVTAMLRGPWARVLERVYLRDGGRTESFSRALATADDLIWSVSPKLCAEERRRLVAMLPSLLHQLQEGIRVAAVDESDGARFFASLVDCHAAAVKAGLRGESVAALFEASSHAREVAPLFDKLIAEERARDEAMKSATRSGAARIQFTDSGVQVEEIALHKADDLSAGGDALSSVDAVADKAAMHAIPEIKRGMWLEFSPPQSGKIRAKLSWISPLKGVYLFTCPGAKEAISIMPDALHAQLRRGDARVVDESSAVDRAVDRMVHTLGQNKVQ